MEIKVGNTVRLKSGSPTMTVSHVEDGDVWVCWFSELKQDVEKNTVKAATLELVIE